MSWLQIHLLQLCQLLNSLALSDSCIQGLDFDAHLLYSGIDLFFELLLVCGVLIQSNLVVLEMFE